MIIDKTFHYLSMQQSLECELTYRIANNDCRTFGQT